MSNNWAYQVTDAQWRNQLVNEEGTLRQIAACKQSGIGADVPMDYSELAHTYLLAYPSDAEKMGVTLREMACLCALYDVEIAGIPEAENRWYAIGKDVQRRIDEAFGHVTHPSRHARRRADALRRANKARKSLK